MSGAEPTLGVLIPTWNEAEALPALLARLGAGEPADRADEIVVADGGSADATRRLARDAGAEVVEAEPGRGTQLAAGALRLGADVLVVLHADCLPEPGALAAVRRAFADGAQVAAMRQRVDADGWFFRAVERCADARVAWLGMIYGDSGLCVSRTLYEAVGGFAAIPLFEDVELSRRLRRRSKPRLVDGAVLRISARRWRREGALRATLRNWMLAAAFLVGCDPAWLARRYRPHTRSRARP